MTDPHAMEEEAARKALEAAAAILNLAREGDIDDDLRSIRSHIEQIDPAQFRTDRHD